MIPNKSKKEVPHEVMVARCGEILQHVCSNLTLPQIYDPKYPTCLSPAMFGGSVKGYLQEHLKGSDLEISGDRVIITLGGGATNRFSPETSRLDIPFGDFWTAVSNIYKGEEDIPTLWIPPAQAAIVPFTARVNRAAPKMRLVEPVSRVGYGGGRSLG